MKAWRRKKETREVLDSIAKRPHSQFLRTEPVERFNLNRPTHLLANDLLERIEHRNGLKFGAETHRDVEMLIRQLREEGFQDDW